MIAAGRWSQLASAQQDQFLFDAVMPDHQAALIPPTCSPLLSSNRPQADRYGILLNSKEHPIGLRNSRNRFTGTQAGSAALPCRGGTRAAALPIG